MVLHQPPAHSPPAVAHAPARLQAIDALRGLAMVWMTVFHFCFDLQHFQLLQADFYRDPFWTWQRSAIVSLFVFCAGLGQAVAFEQAQNWTRFFKRWSQVAGCALLVSAGSYLMFPKSYIYFGILHGLALMLLVTRLAAAWLARVPLLTLGLGALALATPWWAEALHVSAAGRLEVFNTPALNWLGVIGRKPITEDYAPLLPWWGMMLWGLTAGRWALQRMRDTQTPCLSGALFGRLAWLGRWSLSYYMLHQPVMLGALMLMLALRAPH